jgi:hypothetical protein
LVHGRATLSAPVPDYPTVLGEHWDRFEPWSSTGALWKRWQRIYATRVPIAIEVERIVAWPDLGCRGTPVVHGTPLSTDPPASQRKPGKGTLPRIDARAAAAKAMRLPNVLLAWVGADGYPMVVPVDVLGGDAGRRVASVRAAYREQLPLPDLAHALSALCRGRKSLGFARSAPRRSARPAFSHPPG